MYICIMYIQIHMYVVCMNVCMYLCIYLFNCIELISQSTEQVMIMGMFGVM